MTAFASFTSRAKAASTKAVNAFFKISHNGFALLGLALAFCVIALATQPQLSQSLETKITAWLQGRQFDLLGMEVRPDAVERATAINPKDLPQQQAAVTYWLSQKYRIAPEPLGALVSEAYQIGLKTTVEPTLVLAIMAIESGFNPFAQSPVGAQGLMQVMTRVHTEKYESFGGIHAAFDPLTNLRVGVRVLQDCIKRAGSIEGGLRQYVGATATISDGGYVNKVMAEFNRLQQVAAGKSVPVFAPQQVAAAGPAAAPVTSVSVQAGPALENAPPAKLDAPAKLQPTLPQSTPSKTSVGEKVAAAY
ncbi:MAG: lytic transglycosylase domain-containing protein [Pseudomonadota bacterium]